MDSFMGMSLSLYQTIFLIIPWKRGSYTDFVPWSIFIKIPGPGAKEMKWLIEGGGSQVSVKFSSVIHLTVDNYYLRFGRKGR